jgi:hypothetical protein
MAELLSKVKGRKWLDNDKVQTQVRKLAYFFCSGVEGLCRWLDDM